ncbi:hypothetical protein TVAG_432230 [Trichomonas vaginalis G3]|uniref:Uncharacterized protein n=1 Tax=Trichomonas vaginalis (strain ATCC PRA-98 / G3) TaxID=412133 RepID=A2F8T7_TRIV3|nr:hypothetical protein TVAG_432230 [Trichomonas vaginalis G3]|eukprot:XP_001311603.1 hypothetical protein [Trichomonas vaginalis G3]
MNNLNLNKGSLEKEVLQKIPRTDSYYNAITAALGKTLAIIKEIIKISQNDPYCHMLIYINRSGTPTDSTFESLKTLINVPIVYKSHEEAEEYIHEVLLFKELYNKVKKENLQDKIIEKQTMEMFDALKIEDYSKDSAFRWRKNLNKIKIEESESRIFKVKRAVEDRLRLRAERSMFEARALFSGCLSIDARWTHRRKSPSCTVTALDAITGKVIVCVKVNHIGGNRNYSGYIGASNNMESYGTKIILKQLLQHGILKNVKEIIKDKDNTGGKGES